MVWLLNSIYQGSFYYQKDLKIKVF